MLDNLFVLIYSHYEDYVPYYFIGPETATQDDFKKLCDSLLEKAGYSAIDRQQCKEYPSWVGWHDVVESMIPLLEKQGYHCFIPKRMIYSGPGIIEDRDDAKGLKSSIPAILNYNRQKKEEMNERRKNRK